MFAVVRQSSGSEDLEIYLVGACHSPTRVAGNEKLRRRLATTEAVDAVLIDALDGAVDEDAPILRDLRVVPMTAKYMIYVYIRQVKQLRQSTELPFVRLHRVRRVRLCLSQPNSAGAVLPLRQERNYRA